MIGTKPEAFFPKQEADIGDTGAQRARPDRRRFRRGRRFRCPLRRDPGLLRAGRRRPFRDRRDAVRADRSPMPGASSSTAGRSRSRSPREAMRHGISFVPEDRHQQGLVLPFPIRANATLPVLRKPVRPARLDRPQARGRDRRRIRQAHARRRDRHRAGDRHAVRRQSAESAAGQMADAQSRSSSSSISRRAASTSAPRRKSIASFRTSRPRAWRSS